MSFRFVYICNLLDKLHHIFARHPPYLPRDIQQMSTRVITLWFKKHELKIKHEMDGYLLLSILLPEKYAEKLYGLSERDLAKVVGRAFSLSTIQFEDVLHKANVGDLSDLGHRIEHATKQCDLLPYSRAYDASIEEIDQVLKLVASQHSFASHPSPAHLHKSFSTLNDKLGPLYQCLTPRERKWLTRLVLKSYAPIVMPEDLIFSLYHPLLPGLIRVHIDLKAALRFISRLEAEPCPPSVHAGGDHIEVEPAVCSAVAAPAESPPRRDSPASNNESVSVHNEENVSPMLQGVRNNACPPRVLTVSTSCSVQAPGCRKAGSILSSQKKTFQPLSDVTNSGRNRSSVKAQCAEPPIVGRRAGQSIRQMSSQAVSTAPLVSAPRLSTSDSRRQACPKEGKHCLFYKKDIGLLLSVSRSSQLLRLLEKHQVTATSFESFLHSAQQTGRGKVAKKRRILLVDRSRDRAEAAVEQIRALSSQDFKGQKQWIDIYDWRLLEYVDKHGSCGDSRLECVRRCWLGTV